MTKTSEPAPAEKTVRRLIAFSRVNGWSVVIIAALGALAALALSDWSSVGVGVLLAGAGAMEVHGNRRLQCRDESGMRWLVRSQLAVLAIILVYCLARLGSFDRETATGNLTPDMAAVLNEAGISQQDILPLVQMVFYVTYGTVAIVTVVYQGGLALYYRRRRALVAEVLAAPPPIDRQP